MAAQLARMKFFGADTTNAHKIDALKNVPIFHQLTRKELLEVDDLLHERTYEKGEIIFEKGEIGHGVYIILSGRVRVNPCPDLPETALLELAAGDLIGELTLFDEAQRLATLVAHLKPNDLTADENLAFDIAHALVRGGTLPEPLYRLAVATFGQRGTNELIHLVGFYCLVSMTLNGFDVPVPERD